MKGRLERFIVFITGFTVSILAIAYYRHQTIFAKLCEKMAEEQLPGTSAGLMSECLSFEQVLAITAISPLYFLLSVVVGVSAVVLVWKIR